MNVMSRYSFISQFNKEKISRQEATENGIGSVDFKKCDENGDGILSIDELCNGLPTSTILSSPSNSKVWYLTSLGK